MAESILNYEKRPIRYNAIDGVDEMLVGFLLLTLTLLMHVANVAAEGSLWHWKPMFLIADALLLIVFFFGRKFLKDQITYRRTGYVKYRYSKVRSAIAAAIAGAIGALAVMYVSRSWDQVHRERNLILLGSLLWAFLYAYFLIYKTNMHGAYRYVVVLCIAIGPLAIYSAFRNVPDISTLSAATPGGCFLISGVITFWSYLRNTKLADAESAIEEQ